MNKEQIVTYIISDCTGKTAKNLMESTAGQFPDYDIKMKTFPFVRSTDKIDEILKNAEKENAIIAYTFVKSEMRKHLNQLTESYDLEYKSIIKNEITRNCLFQFFSFTLKSFINNLFKLAYRQRVNK